jgi:hypothetical protein
MHRETVLPNPLCLRRSISLIVRSLSNVKDSIKLVESCQANRILQECSAEKKRRNSFITRSVSEGERLSALAFAYASGLEMSAKRLLNSFSLRTLRSPVQFPYGMLALGEMWYGDHHRMTKGRADGD